MFSFYKNYRGFIILIAALFVLNKVQGQNFNNPNIQGPLDVEVNSLSGNLFVPRTDFTISSRGIDFALSFYYNSFYTDQNTGFGNGWSFLYGMSYKNDTANGKTILWGDGREDKYTLNGAVLTPPKGIFITLTQYQTNKFLLRQKDGTKYYFDNPVHKKLTRTEDRNGNFLNFTYTDTLLTGISNAAGQTITLTYQNGRLASITDALSTPSRTFLYAYNTSGQLTQVIDPLGNKMQYTYLVNGPLKTMADKNSNTVDIIYYPDYTVSELIGCNKRQSFSYDTALNLTTVTDYLPGGTNQVTKYGYKNNEQFAWLTSISGNCCGFNMSFEFDADGNKLKETDGNGNTTDYTYDGRGNLLTMKDANNQTQSWTWSADYNRVLTYTDAKGFTTTLTYNASGNLTQVSEPGNLNYTATYAANGDILTSTDPQGNTFTYGYDLNGKPATVTGPDGYKATVSFDARGNLVSQIDALGNTMNAEYDILNRLKKITDPSGNNMKWDYDAQGNIISINDQSSNAAAIKYDASNRPVQVTDALSNKSYIGYDPMDNITRFQNEEGNTATFSYDARNRFAGATDPLGNAGGIGYDAKGNVTSISSPTGQTVSFVYDNLDRVVSMSDLSGPVANMVYDKNDNVTNYTNAAGAVITAAYDSINRISQITDRLGKTTFIGYDKNGNVISYTDRNGGVQSFTYDGLNRIKTYTNANGATVTITYDAQGNTASLKDENNNITQYSYDNMNRLKTTTYPDGKTMQYSYDSRSNIVGKKMTDGTVISFVYDALNRIVSKTLPDGQVYSYTYDGLGRVKTAVNGAGTVNLGYDALDRVTSEEFNGRTTRYSYSVSERTQTIVYPDSTTITKTFDKRNRLLSISKGNSSIVSYQYSNTDMVTGKSFANGVSTSLQYDFADRLNSISTANGTVQNISLTYDNEGLVKTISRQNDPAASETFTYDAAHRLINYKKGPVGGTAVTTSTYAYDAVGNRVSANLNGVNASYSFNNLNQLTANTGSQNVNYVYDNNGNLTYDGKFYKKYDADGKLLKDSSAVNNVLSYLFDGFGRRVQKTYNGFPLKYGYAGEQQIEERDGISGVLKNRTVFKDFLTPVLNEQNNNSFYFHQNQLNSVEAITGNNGSLAEKYVYDAYGKQTIYNAANVPLAGSITGNRFGFTGQEYDSATAGNHFFFRNYSPETGLFNQRDPLGYDDGTGMYQYVHDNPANGVDLFGLDDCGGEKIPDTYTLNDWDNANTLYTNVTAYTEKAYNFRINQKLTRLHALQEFLIHNGSSLEEATNVALKSGEFRELAEVGSSTLSKLGKGLGAADLLIKSIKLYNTATDKNATDNDVRKGVGSVGLSALGFTPPGAIYGLVDFAIEKTTGKNIIDNTDYAGTFYGNLYAHYAYGVPMTYNDPNEKSTPNENGWKPRIINCPQNGNPGGPRTRKYKYYLPNGDSTEIIQSRDPNAIVGPDGLGASKYWVNAKDPLPYTILYENDLSASAPAKYVKVVYPIADKQDANTFYLGTFGFNNQNFTVPSNAPSYAQRLDCRDSLGLYVDVTAGLDVTTNTAFWEFQSIDPVTLLPPSDPLKGLLLLQDLSKPTQGHGFVNFSIKAKNTDVTLDTIHATAKIVFDRNDTIPTNYAKNTVDAFAPTSHLSTLSATSNNPVSLSWSGADDAGGCGLKNYTLYASTDGVNFNILNSGITRKDITFTGAPGTMYYFFVLATDSVGNTESLRPGEVRSTFIGGTLPVTLLYFKGTNQGKDNLLEWATANEHNTKSFILERSLNNTDFSAITNVAAAGNSSVTNYYQYKDKNIDKLKSAVMYYRLQQTDIGGGSKYSNIVRLNYLQERIKSLVYPNPTHDIITLVVGDNTLIGTQAYLVDVNGKLLEAIKITGSNQQLQMNKYVSGTYFIRLGNKETIAVIKL